MERSEFIDHPDFELGFDVGDQIYIAYLPTLSTDMLKTRRVIEVTNQELVSTHNKFEEEFKTAILNPDTSRNYKDIHKEHMIFYRKIIETYLPKRITCAVSLSHLPTDINIFIKGLNAYLYDTDLSHYLAEEDLNTHITKDNYHDDELLHLHYHIITLTRQ